MLKVTRTAFNKASGSVQARHTGTLNSLRSLHSSSPSLLSASLHHCHPTTSIIPTPTSKYKPKVLSHHLTSPLLSSSPSHPLRTSRTRTRTPTHSRAFHATPRASDFHFDTHHFVQRLEREGLNRAQAEGIMSAMAEVIDESIRNMTSNMVTKADQEKVCTSHLCSSFAWDLSKLIDTHRLLVGALILNRATTPNKSTSPSSSPNYN